MTNGILQIDKNFLGSSFTEIKDYELAVWSSQKALIGTLRSDDSNSNGNFKKTIG